MYDNPCKILAEISYTPAYDSNMGGSMMLMGRHIPDCTEDGFFKPRQVIQLF